MTTNGVPLAALPGLVVNSPANSQFTPEDNFHVDMFSISSYSSAGDDYDSVLAHGTVANLVVTASLRPIGRVSGDFKTNGALASVLLCPQQLALYARMHDQLRLVDPGIAHAARRGGRDEPRRYEPACAWRLLPRAR